jgi:hypothetical protein
MTKQTGITVWIVCAAIVTSATAWGQTAKVTEPSRDDAQGAGSAGEKLRLSLTFAPMPFGRVDSALGFLPDETDAAFAFAVAAALDYPVGRFFYLGLAPQYVFNVRKRSGPTNGDQGARELDVRMRAGAQIGVGPGWRLYCHLAPGYSFVQLPSLSSLGDAGDPRGLVVEVAAGTTFDLSRRLFVAAELGYQRGFQTGDSHGFSYDFKTSFFHLGVGLGTRI